MTYKLTLTISVLLTLIYLFMKTRDKVTLAGVSVALLTLVTGKIVTGTVLDRSFPNSSNFVKWTLVAADFLCILIFLFYIFYRSEKYRGSERGKVVPDFRVLFNASPENIAFWIVIILFNLIVFLFNLRN
jgi:hypothetical protein